MKTLLSNLKLIAVICCSTLFAQKPVTTYKRLQVNGSHVTAQNGDKISLAGLSLFWSNAGDVSDFYNAETVDFLANDWEIGLVRAAMAVNPPWGTTTGYIGDPSNQKAKIKKVIDAAIANDIYVIVDWHSHDAENYTSQAVTFFGEIAKEYGHNDHIIYEIYNEPVNQSWSTIKTYAETVIEAIRKEDPDNLIIVGTGFYSQEVNEVKDSPISDPNVAYTLHFYAGTHGQFLRERAGQAMKDGTPLFVTEWGTVSADGNGGVNNSETENWIQFMQDNYISHANWAVGDKNESSSIINLQKGINGLKSGDLTTSGNLIKSIIDTQRLTLSVTDITEIKNKFIFYPNPTTDFITISDELINKDFMIVDLSGKIIDSQKAIQNTINLSQYPKGTYLLQFKEANKTISSEVILKQ